MSEVVIGVGLAAAAFLAIQLVTCAKARREVSLRCGAWIAACESGNYRFQRREAAVQELDRDLAMSPSAGLLRRLGSAAPLFGVMLTATSVILTGVSASRAAGNLGDGDGVDFTTGLNVGPLLAGVCAGAALAMLNQVLLSVLQREEDSKFREALRTVPPSSFVDSDDRMERTLQSLDEAGLRLHQILETMREAAGESSAVVASLRGACGTACESLQVVATKLQEAVTEPSREFSRGAVSLRQASEAACLELKQTAQALSEANEQFHRTASAILGRQSGLVSAHENAARGIQGAARVWTDVTQTLRDDALRGLGTEAHALTDSLQATRAALSNLDPAIARSGAAAETLSSQFEGLSAASTTEIATMADSTKAFQEQVGGTIAALAGARSEIDRLRETAAAAAAAIASSTKAAQDAASASRGVFGWFRG